MVLADVNLGYERSRQKEESKSSRRLLMRRLPLIAAAVLATAAFSTVMGVAAMAAPNCRTGANPSVACKERVGSVAQRRNSSAGQMRLTILLQRLANP